MKKIFLCLIAVIMFPSLVAAQSVSWNFSSRVTIHDGIEREARDIFRAEITRKMIDFGYGDEPALFLRFYDSNPLAELNQRIFDSSNRFVIDKVNIL